MSHRPTSPTSPGWRGWWGACMVAATASTATGGVLETLDGVGTIRGSDLVAPPPVLAAAGDADFSVLAWVRPNGAAADGGILGAGDALSVTLQGGVVEVRMPGAPASPEVDLPAGPMPDDGGWLLVALAYDADDGTLDGWLRSEHGFAGDGAASVPGWSGSLWPVTLGATGAEASFTGHLGLVVVRGERLRVEDIEAIWNGGAPDYFAPVLRDAGAMNGFDGVAWMTGHGICTGPRDFVNGDPEPSLIDGPATADNLLVYSTGDASNYFSPGLFDEVCGAWTFRRLHEPLASWSGFFARAVPDLDIGEERVVPLDSPNAQRLADDEPRGLIRVIASANSRGVRPNGRFYGDGMENWAYGGLWGVRRHHVAGVIVPVWHDFCVDWIGFECTARRIGDVRDTAETPYDSVAFGHFGSHGVQSNDHFPGEPLVGLAVVIEPGAAYVPKARPEPGTRFDQITDPLTVRAMVLRFPGSGTVAHFGEKAVTQDATEVTVSGDPTIETLDTTVHVHELTKLDVVQPALGRIVIDGPLPGVEVGHACYVGDGDGAGGISVIVALEAGVGQSIVTVERWFPTDPAPGSVLRFGPVEPHWIEHAWPGLAAADPEIFRGVHLAAHGGGPVVVLFLECFNPDADGFVLGGVGQSGSGHGVQLDRMFSDQGVPFMAGLDADVWLQFFAHQGSTPDSMAAWAQAIRSASADTEIWWCADPFLWVDDTPEPMTAWHEFIMGEAAAHDVGAVVASDHPWVGTAHERAIDGQSANTHHPSELGCAVYVAATLDLLREAAAPRPECTGDFNGDGIVGTGDLAAFMTAWGGTDVEFDIAPPGGDGHIGVPDLVAMLLGWGDCP